MESCYIPNNPQYGLTLEYTAYNNAANFNGTLAGFPSSCDPVSDSVLCCSGTLQDCTSCSGPLDSLRDCVGSHCHLNCENGECGGTLDTINGHLDECNGGLDDCSGRLVNCERLEDCEGRLVNCDNSLVNCGIRLVESEDRLANCKRSLDNSDVRLVQCDNLAESDGHQRDCDGRLIDNCNGRLDHCERQLGNCDDSLRNCGDHLVECSDALRDCDNRLTNCDGSLDNCSDQLADCDDQLGGCGDRLVNCDERLGNCDDHLTNCEDHLTNCNNRLGDCGDHRLGDCDGRLGNCGDGRLGDCDDRLGDCNDRLGDCDDRLGDCDDRLGDCNDRLGDCDDRLGDCDDRLGFEECRGALGPGQAGPGYWIPDEMASCSFSLPPLDLDPLPSLFPFSPCSGNYKGELKEKQPHEVADVLLSLKHAVVHPGAELGVQYGQQDLALHPQMVMGGPGCYDSCGAGVFPTMSVNVSMNMTMHGYPPDQMCPQMQWGQNPSSSPMNVMYSQNQGVISPAPYPGSATYSFTADFRTPNQSDPLITATSSFKPIQLNQKCQQNVPNYNIFSQKPVQSNFGALNPNLVQKPQGFGSPNHSQNKTRSTAKLQLTNEHQLSCGSVGPTYQILGSQNQGHLNPHLGYPQLGNGVSLQNGHSLNGGKVQIGSLSGCSGSEDEQKPNLCRICGKTYARPSTLKTHLRTHSGERPYRCSDCNKSFSQAANLTAHVRTHTGQKPFSCQICHRRFSQSSSVTTHMRTHSGERPYRCRACKKAFSDSSTLTKHLRIHSGEKPYQCKLCFLRFSQSGNLNRHMRVHGNNAAMLG